MHNQGNRLCSSSFLIHENLIVGDLKRIGVNRVGVYSLKIKFLFIYINYWEIHEKS
ncbi:hypothetical protein J18TS1_34420 [Oceanobacillus oncorhynchi subsp. incaldanensis]|nr:hypothetical protein J18TS1_34420 [Oceanobacillus oncorhynchi subsp. incaldanensis]